MLLAVDIGNTKIAAGLFAPAAGDSGETTGAGPVCHWRLASSAERTEDEYSVTLNGLFSAAGYAQSDLTGAILCSVVPSLTGVLASAVGMCVGAAPVVLDDGEAASVASGMAVLADDAREVGADRVVNAHSAYSACGGPVVVVDMGTAVTVDLVSAAGEFCGGAIAPGVMISAEALHRGTARLYALGYLNTAPVYNYNLANDSGGVPVYDTTDRSRTLGTGIPSGMVTVISPGGITAIVGVGGSLVTPPVKSSGTSVPTYWREVY